MEAKLSATESVTKNQEEGSGAKQTSNLVLQWKTKRCHVPVSEYFRFSVAWEWDSRNGIPKTGKAEG